LYAPVFIANSIIAATTGYNTWVRIFFLLLAAAGLGAQAPSYDVLIVHGRVFDGTGGAWYRADVGLRGDTIAAVGDLRGAAATVTIDARDLAVAPGFIDIHSHGRRGIFEVPLAENYIRQGVTSIIEGPDGSSPLPLGPYLDKIAALHAAVNFGAFVGQGTIRQEVVGLEDRKATAAEIAQMQELVREAMRQGAFGLSTGLFYVPGAYTPTEEVIALARAAGELGGIHISHMRNEAGGVIESVAETIRIGEEGHLPTQVTHHKVIGKANWGASVRTLALVEAARARGVDATIDAYPYTASSTGTSALFPRWSLEGGHAQLVKRLTDPATRERIKAAVVDSIRDERGAGDPKNVVLAACGFDSHLAGKSLADLAVGKGLPPTLENGAEEAIAIEIKGGCSAVYHAISEEDVERILKYPFTMVASDGGIPVLGQEAPHPRNYGTFARVLGRYARERKLLTLEDAVRRMTALPAARLKLMDRGLLRPGMKADIAVFDPAMVADKATFLQPHQYAAGMVHVFVNGVAALRDAKMTGQRPGRVLYGGARR
jgi:dihydroorotase/N-acyl-D-amino-acid deacylase